MRYRLLNCFFVALLATGLPLAALSQLNDRLSSLYEQATEVSGLVTQYGQDVRAIEYFYGPMASSFGRGGGVSVHSPEQLARLEALNKEYLDQLQALDFNAFSIYGQVDYILLKRKIERSQEALAAEKSNYQKIVRRIPFADSIYVFEQLRRRGTTVDGEAIAGSLHGALQQLQQVHGALEKEEPIDAELADYAVGVVQDLKARLKNAFDFYNGYDPLFTWWVPEPYKALDTALQEYAKRIGSKSNAKPFDDGSNIGGKPIGREAFAKALLDDMIPYTPEELLKLADKEFAWCEAELLKASREMGFGDNWKAAQEKVKNSYVAPGKQPELIIKLYKDANDFIKANDLVTMPPLSEETWGMIMMTPEQQLVSPFFLGGRNIMVSYPTNTMSHDRKLMSMRGNNPYFSRGTVQHELVPGHHLQYFMNSRYKPYRAEAFRTPFWTEGWTLYWELLLYDLGFAKTPEERIGMLFWRMHRCARITFSIKYHLGEWTPQQCVDYLVERVGHEPSTAHGEVKRSFEANYGPLYQLAYLTGGLQMWSLKKELVDSGKMTYKAFHDRVIKENYLPIEMLRATLTDQKLSRDFKSSWKFYDFSN
ncbi:DUF885 family protein [Parapedobacter sp. ISTM3]|uniref:Uncharacterized conserved protein, DUF885 familyt n=1 Tax=Parapedobacter luteus TaxID=623280 RepID=A0A1T4ZWM1_9SPHI|nr:MULTISPECIES: DUF885 family protein [Parapedobacter]MBK1438686.1 DUF885 family protein [Parapedobacter sp. ISTM3]SKB26743.1 Uncharacterized conserved protein, DUF885 familyt [Parapedobacter luteus]